MRPGRGRGAGAGVGRSRQWWGVRREAAMRRQFTESSGRRVLLSPLPRRPWGRQDTSCITLRRLPKENPKFSSNLFWLVMVVLEKLHSWSVIWLVNLRRMWLPWVLRSILLCSIPTEDLLSSTYGIQLVRRNLVDWEMAIRYQFSMPL